MPFKPLKPAYFCCYSWELPPPAKLLLHLLYLILPMSYPLSLMLALFFTSWEICCCSPCLDFSCIQMKKEGGVLSLYTWFWHSTLVCIRAEGPQRTAVLPNLTYCMQIINSLVVCYWHFLMNHGKSCCIESLWVLPILHPPEKWCNIKQAAVVWI